MGEDCFSSSSNSLEFQNRPNVGGSPRWCNGKKGKVKFLNIVG